MFGAGTACVVCPINQMQFLDEVSNVYILIQKLWYETNKKMLE